MFNTEGTEVGAPFEAQGKQRARRRGEIEVARHEPSGKLRTWSCWRILLRKDLSGSHRAGEKSKPAALEPKAAALSAGSDSFTFCNLSLQKEGLWEFAFTANLEGIEVFVPEPFGSLGIGFAPEFQFVQVFGGDLALFEAIEKVLAESGRKIRPLNLEHGSLTLTGSRKSCARALS